MAPKKRTEKPSSCARNSDQDSIADNDPHAQMAYALQEDARHKRMREHQDIPPTTQEFTQMKAVADAASMSDAQWQHAQLLRNRRTNAAIPRAQPEMQPGFSTHDFLNENNNQVIQVISEETTKQNLWLKLRESLIGTHSNPEAKPKLQQFLQSIMSGMIPTSIAEQERYQVLNTYMSHWLRFALIPVKAGLSGYLKSALAMTSGSRSQLSIDR